MDRGKGHATGGRDAAAKRQYELYCSSAESLFDERASFGLEDLDQDQDMRSLQCPYCLDEMCDVTSLRQHVECQHPYEYKEHRRRLPEGASGGGYSEGALLREIKRTLQIASSGGGSSGSGGGGSSGSGGGGGSSSHAAAAAAAKQRHLSTLLDLGLRAEDLDDDDDDDMPIMALLKALSSSTSAATAMRAPAVSRLADPLEHYDDRAPASRLLHHEEARRAEAAGSAYCPQPSTSTAAPAAPSAPVHAATEESDLQVQFVQQLILSSMGL